MENGKPSYEEIEKELNEYKDLLWQLSDEYKENLGAAEKKLAELQEKYQDSDSIESKAESELSDSFIKQLGLPACMLDHEGNILSYNNKFKFLIELLSFEIEDVVNISFLLQRDSTHSLLKKYEEFQSTDSGLFQSVYKIRNAFQGLINILLRIYRFEEKTSSLALFIELNPNEIEDLTGSPTPDIIEEPVDNIQIKEQDPETNVLKTDIAIFAEKYEVFSELIKLFNVIKGNLQKEGKSDNIHKEIINLFAMENTRAKILEKLSTQYKKFRNEFSGQYPELTSNEEKHFLLIKAGLTYKEIASIMDISINGVKIARNRLRKKLNLENETKTSEFISQF